MTNLDGGTVRVAAGLTDAAPESFDLNGVWTASSVDGSDRGLGFTIEKNRLVSAHCHSVDGLRFPSSVTSPPLIVNGEFAIEGVGQSLSYLAGSCRPSRWSAPLTLRRVTACCGAAIRKLNDAGRSVAGAGGS